MIRSALCRRPGAGKRGQDVDCIHVQECAAVRIQPSGCVRPQAGILVSRAPPRTRSGTASNATRKRPALRTLHCCSVSVVKQGPCCGPRAHGTQFSMHIHTLSLLQLNRRATCPSRTARDTPEKRAESIPARKSPSLCGCEPVFVPQSQEISLKLSRHRQSVDTPDPSGVLVFDDLAQIALAWFQDRPSVKNRRAAARTFREMIFSMSPMMSVIFEPVAP